MDPRSHPFNRPRYVTEGRTRYAGSALYPARLRTEASHRALCSIAVSDAIANAGQRQDPRSCEAIFWDKFHLSSRASDSFRFAELVKESSVRCDIPARFHF